MRAAVYLRISDDKAGEELGVARQREDTEALVRQRGWTLIESFVDNDISASDKGKKTRRRPAYEALMAAADAKQIDRIVVWHTSRFWRSRRERADGIERLKNARVSVVPVKGPELDMTTAYGRGMAGLVGEFDTMEVEVKSERQTREAQQRAADGKPPGGRRAFGYAGDGMTVIPAEKRALRKAYKDLVAGKALSAIAADLNAAGLTTTMGGPWKHNAVRNMLANPRYIKKRTYRGEVVGDAIWPALVDVETWNAAQEILSGPDRRTNHVGSERKWLGGGVYRCGRCGERVRCTYRERYDDGQPRRVYRCPSCKLSRLAEPIDALVDAVIREVLHGADLAEFLADPGVDEAARKRLADLRRRRRSLATLLVDGTLTEDEVRDEAKRLDALIKAETPVSTGDRRALAAVASAPNPVAYWDDADMQTRADLVEKIAVIRLKPTPPGVRLFDDESVKFDWIRP